LTFGIAENRGFSYSLQLLMTELAIPSYSPPFMFVHALPTAKMQAGLSFAQLRLLNTDWFGAMGALEIRRVVAPLSLCGAGNGAEPSVTSIDFFF
jgi:hypothetical protein